MKKFTLKERVHIATIRTMHRYGFENWRTVVMSRICDLLNIV